MKLIILDQTFQYPNETNSIEECFNQIGQMLETNDYVIDYLEIDGNEVFEDHQEYIQDRLKEVHVIDVKVKTYKQLIDATVLSLEQYLDRLLPEIKSLADQFYQGPVQETWVKLEQLFQGLQWILQAIHPIYTMRGNELPYKNSLEYSIVFTALTEQFLELEAVLTRSDLVSVGDILKYEILDQLEQLKAAIIITIENEVARNDLNL